MTHLGLFSMALMPQSAFALQMKHDCVTAGLPVLTPQLFVSVHVRLCCPPLQALHAVHDQLGVHVTHAPLLHEDVALQI